MDLEKFKNIFILEAEDHLQKLNDNLKIKTIITKDNQALDSYDLALTKSTVMSASGHLFGEAIKNETKNETIQIDFDKPRVSPYVDKIDSSFKTI